MFHWLRGEEEEGEQGTKRWSDSINALYQYVRAISLEVSEIKMNLADGYSSEGFSMISGRFERMSKDFSDLTIKRHHIFYSSIQRSNERKTTVKRISAQAKRVAKLFERYARNSRFYSPVDSRLAIDRLLAELENLETNCAINGAVDS